MPNTLKTKRITPAARTRIHSAEAKAGGGKVKAGSFTARVQRTIDGSQKVPKKNSR